MSIQLDYNDLRCAQAATEILRLHDAGELEVTITTGVRDALIVTGLVRAGEIVEENPLAHASGCAADLAALDTLRVFKRRTGTAGGFSPNVEHVQQIDDYLEQPEGQGPMPMGILNDGQRYATRLRLNP